MQSSLDINTALIGSQDFLQCPYPEAVEDFSTRLHGYAEKGLVRDPKIEPAEQSTRMQYTLVGVGFSINVKLQIYPDPRDPTKGTAVESEVLVSRTLGLPRM